MMATTVQWWARKDTDGVTLMLPVDGFAGVIEIQLEMLEALLEQAGWRRAEAPTYDPPKMQDGGQR